MDIIGSGETQKKALVEMLQLVESYIRWLEDDKEEKKPAPDEYFEQGEKHNHDD